MLMKQQNTFLYQLNSFLSLLTVSLYFCRKFSSYKIKRIVAIYPIAIVAQCVLAVIILTETSLIFNSRSYSFTALLITGYTIIYYYQKLAHPDIERITASRSFWFVTGLFFYYSGCFIIFCTYRIFIQTATKQFPILWGIHNVITLIMCIIFSIGFRCKSYPKILSL